VDGKSDRRVPAIFTGGLERLKPERSPPQHKQVNILRVLPTVDIDNIGVIELGWELGLRVHDGEDTVGTLEPGKFSDFAVLEKDFFTVPVEEVLKMKVVMTGLSGKIVYRD